MNHAMSDDADDEPVHEEPPLKDVPADEQHAYDKPAPFNFVPRIMVLVGAALFAAAVIGWKRMGLDFPYEGWQRFLPALTFMLALCGGGLVFYGVYLSLLEPQPDFEDRFSAWGRFGLGIAFTFVGIAARNFLMHQKTPPPEPMAVAMMCLISGPVLCGWACYGTFVKDRSQRDTGLLMIAALAAFLALMLWS